MVERRNPTGVDVIRGLVLSQIGEGTRTEQVYTGREEWFAVLEADFGLSFDASSAAAADRLWASVQASHRDWLGQP